MPGLPAQPGLRADFASSGLGPRENGFDRRPIGRAHDSRLLNAVLDIDERGPQLHPERPAERLTFTVFDLDVSHRGMRLQHRGDVRLRCLAVATPGGSELEHERFVAGVNFLTPRFIHDSNPGMTQTLAGRNPS